MFVWTENKLSIVTNVLSLLRGYTAFFKGGSRRRWSAHWCVKLLFIPICIEVVSIIYWLLQPFIWNVCCKVKGRLCNYVWNIKPLIHFMNTRSISSSQGFCVHECMVWPAHAHTILIHLPRQAMNLTEFYAYISILAHVRAIHISILSSRHDKMLKLEI